MRIQLAGTGTRHPPAARPASPRCSHDGTRAPHYRVEREHLQYYLDGFAFRCNRRRSRARGMLFYRLLQQSVNTDPHPLAELVGGTAADDRIDDQNAEPLSSNAFGEF